MNLRERWVEILLLVACAVLLRSAWDLRPVGLLDDDSAFILAARDWLGQIDYAPPRARNIGPSLYSLPFLWLSPSMEEVQWGPTLLALLTLCSILSCAQSLWGRTAGALLTLAVALSPTFCCEATAVMGAPLLLASVWATVLLLRFDFTPVRVALLMTVCLSAALARTEGVLTFLALLAALAYENRSQLRKRARIIIPASGTITLVAVLLNLNAVGIYVKAISSWFLDSGAWSYPKAWATTALHLLGGTFFLGLPYRQVSKAGIVLALVLICGAFIGIRRLPASRPYVFLRCQVVLLIAALAFWPYPDARHFLTLWSLLLFCSTAAFQRSRLRLGWLVFWICLSLGFGWTQAQVARTNNGKLKATLVDLGDWLKKNTKEDSLLMGTDSHSLCLFSERRAYTPNSLSDYHSLLEYVALGHFDYVVLDRQKHAIQDVFGQLQFESTLTLFAWLEGSPHFERVYMNSRFVVFLVHPPGDDYPRSVKLYRKALELDWELQAKESEELLREADRVYPGLPIVQSNLGCLLISKGEVEEGVSLLENVLRQYPFDLNTIYNLVLADQRAGRTERANQLAQEGLKVAIRLQNSAMQLRFQEFLKNNESRGSNDPQRDRSDSK